MPTVADYVAAFEAERKIEYPAIDCFEEAMGFAIDRAWLEHCAAVLQCPVKANPPNWQHGRVIYAAARRYLMDWKLRQWAVDDLLFLDIGTAKGFSAVVMSQALKDARVAADIVSVDVVDPYERRPRNSIADLETLVPNVFELADRFAAPGPTLHFECAASREWLKRCRRPRIHVAFVDGKHSYDAVRLDMLAISAYQASGDVMIFDDLQIEPVALAVDALTGYAITPLSADHRRQYAIAVKI